MKVLIEKELDIELQKSKTLNSEDPACQTKLLMQGSESEELRILRNLSKESELSRIEEKRGKGFEFDKHEMRFEGNVYEYEQIKKLAVDYNLKFLRVSEYKGSFDENVGKKILEFSDKFGTPKDEYSLGKRYYLLGPNEIFENGNSIFDTTDRLLFFKIDEGYYRLIHKWGEKFSIIRSIQGFGYRNYFTYFTFILTFILPIVTLIMCLSVPLIFSLNYTYWFMLLVIILSSIISIIIVSNTHKTFFSEEHFTSLKKSNNDD